MTRTPSRMPMSAIDLGEIQQRDIDRAANRELRRADTRADADDVDDGALCLPQIAARLRASCGHSRETSPRTRLDQSSSDSLMKVAALGVPGAVHDDIQAAELRRWQRRRRPKVRPGFAQVTRVRWRTSGLDIFSTASATSFKLVVIDAPSGRYRRLRAPVRSQIAVPMPPLAPLTSATFPLSFRSIPIHPCISAAIFTALPPETFFYPRFIC